MMATASMVVIPIRTTKMTSNITTTTSSVVATPIMVTMPEDNKVMDTTMSRKFIAMHNIAVFRY